MMELIGMVHIIAVLSWAKPCWPLNRRTKITHLRPISNRMKVSLSLSKWYVFYRVAIMSSNTWVLIHIQCDWLWRDSISTHECLSVNFAISILVTHGLVRLHLVLAYRTDTEWHPFGLIEYTMHIFKRRLHHICHCFHILCVKILSWFLSTFIQI